MILSIFIYLAALLFFIFAMMLICSHIVWQPANPLYIFLHLIAAKLDIIAIIIAVFGILLLIFLFQRRLIQMIEDLLQNSTLLIKDDDEPIELHSDLKEAEYHLNLLKNQFRSAQHAAKEAEQKKNDLVVYLAHDLKTPLTSIIGYLSLLNDEKDISQATRKQWNEIVLNKAYRLEDLINEFFDITRFSLTSIPLQKRNINLSMMLEQVSSEFEPMLKEKGCSISLELEKDLHAEIDSDKMLRVFDNLLRNALNYSDSNSMINISLKQKSNTLIIEFTNRGPDIDPQQLNHLFEQFYRLDSSRQTKSGGSGLGLAITRQIMELHQGTITAKSSNHLITFTLQLPVRIS